MFPQYVIQKMSKVFCFFLAFLAVGGVSSFAQSKKEQITVLTYQRDSIASLLIQSEKHSAELRDTLVQKNQALIDSRKRITALEYDDNEAAKSIKSLNDSIAAHQQRYKTLGASELQARDEIKRGNRRLDSLLAASAKTLADSLSANQLRYKLLMITETQARDEVKRCKFKIDSLYEALAQAKMLKPSSTGASGLNANLRGDWEKFRDEVLQKFDPGKKEVLELAFLNLEELHHQELESDIYYRTNLISDGGDNMIEPSQFERSIGFLNNEFVEVVIVMRYTQPSGALGVSSTSKLLDKNTGEMMGWDGLVLEGHQEAVSALFAKKSRPLLAEIAECVGDREMAEILISDFSNLESMSVTNGVFTYPISADDDGVTACSWDVSIGMNELRSHMSPRLYKQ